MSSDWAYSGLYSVKNINGTNYFEYFNSNCGVHGIGVFCRNTLVTVAEYNEMYSAMQSGEISRDMFSAMIWYVLETRLGAFLNRAPEIWYLNFFFFAY